MRTTIDTTPPRPAASALLSVGFAASGCALVVAVYQSLQPLAVFGIAYVSGAMLTALAADRRASLGTYSLLFAVGCVMAGVGGLYAEAFRDPLQLGSDAGMFYDLARSEATGLSVDELVTLTEGVGAVVVWRLVYDAMEAIGFDKGRYIGLAINIVAVSLTGVLASRACQRLFPGDAHRLGRLRLMLAGCGLFWLFSAVHLRDASILLLVTLTFYIWLLHLLRPGGTRLVVTLATTALLSVGLGLLRQEFVLVPPLIAAIAVLTWLLLSPLRPAWQGLRIVGAGLGLGAALVLALILGSDVGEVVTRSSDVYGELVAQEAAADSLGAALIVQQPTPVRAIVGMAHLLLYPVPVWSGLQLESVSAMLKSLNAFFFYAFTPLLFVAAWRTVMGQASQHVAGVYMLSIVLLFGVGIALTSLESRHFGAFLVPAFCLAVDPDLRTPTLKRQYWVALGLLLSVVLLVHAAWLLIKFG